MAKELSESEQLKEVAAKVIEEYPRNLSLGNARIEYVLVHPEISKTTAGRCIRTNTELKHFSNADYIIEMSAELWNKLDDNIQKMLMLHELAHIECFPDDKTGEYRYGMRDHDVQDFMFMIKEFGIDWIKNIKTITASIYDVAEVDLGEIKM